MKRVISFVVVFLLFGCTVADKEGEGNGLLQYYDRERGVVCYRVVAREGLSCLKVEAK